MKKDKKHIKIIFIIVPVLIIIAIIITLLILKNSKEESKNYSDFVLDSSSKYIVTTI